MIAGTLRGMVRAASTIAESGSRRFASTSFLRASESRSTHRLRSAVSCLTERNIVRPFVLRQRSG